MKKYRLGISFGVYELFHIGHLNLIKQAKNLCDKLIICVSDDNYILYHKKHSSVMPLSIRLEIISSIKYVDVVDIQSIEYGKKELIKKYNPDVIFVGNDWTPATFGGEGLGIPVIYLNRTDGISSTQLREKYFQ